MRACCHRVSFVKDADSSVIADGLVERGPRRPVALVAITRICFQAVKIAPVLQKHDRAMIAQQEFGSQKAAFGVFGQFRDHRTHRPRHGKPFSNFVEMVDPHADQKHDKRAVEICGEAAGDNIAHANKVAFRNFFVNPRFQAVPAFDNCAVTAYLGK